MKTPTPGANATVFLLFFGVALLDALRSHDWLRAAFWVAIGLVFLRGDRLPHPASGRAPHGGGPRPTAPR
ncbi:MAG: hypothetical protein ACJ8GN_28145 [Longimicrobiaceae bacterium]